MPFVPVDAGVSKRSDSDEHGVTMLNGAPTVNGTAADHGGAGLGLPVARSVIELHGGNFDLSSRKGKGTRVTIHLPGDRVTTRRPTGESD